MLNNFYFFQKDRKLPYKCYEMTFSAPVIQSIHL